MQKRKAEIEKAGGVLIAISMDPPEQSAGMLEDFKKDQTPITFPLLSDPEKKVIKAFGVYDSRHDFALPAILILDKSGKLAWKHISETITDRPQEDALIKALESVG